MEKHVTKLLVSLSEAAEAIGVCRRTVDNLIAAKQLPARKIGRRTLIPYSALITFVRRTIRHERPKIKAGGATVIKRQDTANAAERATVALNMPPDAHDIAFVLSLAARGLRLHPCVPRAKTPLLRDWPTLPIQACRMPRSQPSNRDDSYPEGHNSCD